MLCSCIRLIRSCNRIIGEVKEEEEAVVVVQEQEELTGVDKEAKEKSSIPLYLQRNPGLRRNKV